MTFAYVLNAREVIKMMTNEDRIKYMENLNKWKDERIMRHYLIQWRAEIEKYYQDDGYITVKFPLERNIETQPMDMVAFKSHLGCGTKGILIACEVCYEYPYLFLHNIGRETIDFVRKTVEGDLDGRVYVKYVDKKEKEHCYCISWKQLLTAIDSGEKQFPIADMLLYGQVDRKDD